MAALPRYGRSLKHRERASQPPSGAQDISEASVIPEMREREVGSREEKKSTGQALKKKKKSPRTKGKAKKRRVAPLRIALDGRADAERAFLRDPRPVTSYLDTFSLTP